MRRGERETLKWLATGVSNKHIARHMNVAESTIKVHVQSILRKLNLISRVQAAVYAVEHGLISKKYSLLFVIDDLHHVLTLKSKGISCRATIRPMFLANKLPK